MEETQKEEAPRLLALDAPRVVALKGKTQSFRYHLRRVIDADWRRYFAAIVRQTLHVAGQREEVFDADTALLDLVGSVLVKVEGYGQISGDGWREALPYSHRMAVGIVLRNVGASGAGDDARPHLSDRAEVRLHGAWSTEGHITLHEGLVHRFRHPSAEHLKRFHFESSRVIVRGNAENGVSIYPSRQGAAMSLYDELIDSVEGYSVNGEPLEGAEAIRREMDGAHKAAAALELFQGGEEVEIE